jgi:hypothetical protein
MLSKCLNPVCSTPFRYLREGRIFKLEIPLPGSSGYTHRRELFWLCGPCSKTMMVVLRDNRAAVMPRFPALQPGQLVEPSEKARNAFAPGPI